MGWVHRPQQADGAAAMQLDSQAGKVVLRGTGGVEIASALNWYMNDYLNITYVPTCANDLLTADQCNWIRTVQGHPSMEQVRLEYVCGGPGSTADWVCRARRQGVAVATPGNEPREATRSSMVLLHECVYLRILARFRAMGLLGQTYRLDGS